MRPPRLASRPRVRAGPCAGWTLALLLRAPGPASAAPPPPRVDPRHGLRAIEAPRTDTSVALEPDGGGRLRHRATGFTAIIHPDGSVEFHDRRQGEVDASFLGFDPFRMRLKEPPPERHDPSWAAVVERAVFPMGQMPILVGVGGSFGGLSDWTRKHRHVAAKKAFLAATEALRTRMALEFYRGRLQARLAALGGELVAIWRDPKLPLLERKRRIFRLWDECEEATPASPAEFDRLRAAGGRAARRKIEAYVRLVAPPGSPDAFTDAELARLNATRRSRSPFRPDAPADEPADDGLPAVEAAVGEAGAREPADVADAPASEVPIGPAPPPRWAPPRGE